MPTWQIVRTVVDNHAPIDHSTRRVQAGRNSRIGALAELVAVDCCPVAVLDGLFRSLRADAPLANFLATTYNLQLANLPLTTYNLQLGNLLQLTTWQFTTTYHSPLTAYD